MLKTLPALDGTAFFDADDADEVEFDDEVCFSEDDLDLVDDEEPSSLLLVVIVSPCGCLPLLLLLPLLFDFPDPEAWEWAVVEDLKFTAFTFISSTYAGA